MKYSAALLALICMSAPALAECERPAYMDAPGSRFASAALLPLTAAVTVLLLPTGVIGAATGNPTLRQGTSDSVCMTTGLASHVVVGRR
jgi:hypothetical protein